LEALRNDPNAFEYPLNEVFDLKPTTHRIIHALIKVDRLVPQGDAHSPPGARIFFSKGQHRGGRSRNSQRVEDNAFHLVNSTKAKPLKTRHIARSSALILA
jgi:hypothetical protein